MKWDIDNNGNPDMKHILTILIPFLIVILCLPAILSAISQPSGGKMTESKPALPKTVGPWTRPGSPRLITAKTIFDYMDGAGELYLGYRFDHLEVYEYKAPTQKEISYTGVTIARLEGGKIVDHRTCWDTLAVLEQLGVVPAIRKEDGTRL